MLNVQPPRGQIEMVSRRACWPAGRLADERAGEREGGRAGGLMAPIMPHHLLPFRAPNHDDDSFASSSAAASYHQVSSAEADDRHALVMIFRHRGLVRIVEAGAIQNARS